jgi:predicted PurR-regulated permease PerM
MKSYPTAWQRKILWSALTALALAFIAGLAITVLIYVGVVLGFLQPLLIPVAAAGILAYLLEPVVDKFCLYGIERTKAVIYVFLLILLPLVGICFWVIPEIVHQSLQFARDVPGYIEASRLWIEKTIKSSQQRFGDIPYIQDAGTYLQQLLPSLPDKIWAFVRHSVTGFLGVFGFVLGLVVVPVYLFFFLRDAANISRRWPDYLPIRASDFKNEVVSCVMEINTYIIAFFRGQILVTMIDGLLIFVCLLIADLRFALLFGLMVAILQLVPYLGIILSCLPALLTAAVQFQDWKHPLIVLCIFIVVSNLDSFFIAPRIVGGSVGLHPMTIIISVFAWSLLFGGLLGALLAVPLTATLKVLLKRYIWQRGFDTSEKDGHALRDAARPLRAS